MKPAAERGATIARLLRAALDRPSFTADDVQGVGRMIPLLLDAGVGGAAWHALSTAGLLPAGAEALHDAWRRNTLQGALRRRDAGRLFAALHARGLQPIMGKGIAIARRYPQPGLRPAGDIDLYVRASEHAAVAEAVRGLEPSVRDVDLHVGAAELDDRAFDVLLARAETFTVDGVPVVAFGAADHLRLVCLHMLREGVVRPLWLCDVAMALRALPPDFDWAPFLEGEARRTEWAVAAIGLAHRLLGVPLDGFPLRERADQVPQWATDTVLREWGAGRLPNGRRLPMRSYLRDPRGLLGALWRRWPNPIEATVNVGGRFNRVPRLPYQLASCLRRTLGFARTVGR